MLVENPGVKRYEDEPEASITAPARPARAPETKSARVPVRAAAMPIFCATCWLWPSTRKRKPHTVRASTNATISANTTAITTPSENELPNNSRSGRRASPGSSALVWARCGRLGSTSRRNQSVVTANPVSCRATNTSSRVEITSGTPRLNRIAAAIPAKAPPEMAPMIIPAMRRPTPGPLTLVPTTAIPIAPMSSWPSWPMLNRPERTATTVPSATSSIGIATVRVLPHRPGASTAPSRRAPNTFCHELPVIATSNPESTKAPPMLAA